MKNRVYRGVLRNMDNFMEEKLPCAVDTFICYSVADIYNFGRTAFEYSAYGVRGDIRSDAYSYLGKKRGAVNVTLRRPLRQ